MGAYRGLAFIIGSETGYTSFDGSYTFDRLRASSSASLPVSFLLFLRARHRDRLPDAPHRLRPALLCGRQQPRGGLDRRRRRRAAEDPGLHARRRACRRSRRWSGSASTARRAATTPTASILFVVTAVVLGGIDINGGKGSILGVVLALLPARHAPQRHGPRQHRRTDPDRRARRASHRRRAAPGDPARRSPTAARLRRPAGGRRELREGEPRRHEPHAKESSTC